MNKKIFQFIASILVCQLPGLVGALFTVSAIPSWYNALSKPSFNPPAWVFGPAWTTLYLMIGISLFFILVNKARSERKQQALGYFLVQYVLNGLWSPVFFGLQSPLMGLVVIGFLWVSIVLTIISFYKISKPAAALLVPYLLWVTFATVLNFSIWQLNS